VPQPQQQVLRGMCLQPARQAGDVRVGLKLSMGMDGTDWLGRETGGIKGKQLPRL